MIDNDDKLYCGIVFLPTEVSGLAPMCARSIQLIMVSALPEIGSHLKKKNFLYAIGKSHSF